MIIIPHLLVLILTFHICSMYTTKVVLLSEKGRIADAIADLIPNSSEVRRLELIIDQLHVSGDDFDNTDAIILNLSSLEHNGTKVLKILLSLDIPIIVLHLYHQKTFADAFLRMGASAYLPVNFYSEDLLVAINAVLKKKTFIAKNVF